jgi:competence protein ComEA
MRSWAIPLSAGLVVPALLAAAWAAGAPKISDQSREARAVIAVCGRCHDMQIVMDTPKSYDAWQETMQKMVDLGAKGTDHQYDDIMDFLHRTITTIDVNSADADELELVLDTSAATAQAIVARRQTKKFTGLADLKSVPGMDAATVDSKARLLFFN